MKYNRQYDYEIRTKLSIISKANEKQPNIRVRNKNKIINYFGHDIDFKV